MINILDVIKKAFSDTDYISVPKGGRPPKQIPDDLAVMSSKLTIKQMSEHYGVSTATISRWLRKNDIYKTG